MNLFVHTRSIHRAAQSSLLLGMQERYRSSYERKHPLVPPKTLKLGSGSLTVLRTMGLGKKSKKALGSDNLYDMYRQDDDSPVSTTGLWGIAQNGDVSIPRLTSFDVLQGLELSLLNSSTG